MSNLSTTNCPQDAAETGADREGNWGIIIDIVRACMVRTSLCVGIGDIVLFENEDVKWHHKYWLNSTVSQLGPVILKYFTPFSQKGRNTGSGSRGT